MKDTDQGNKPGKMPPMEGNKARPKLPENPEERQGLQLSGVGEGEERDKKATNKRDNTVDGQNDQNSISQEN